MVCINNQKCTQLHNILHKYKTHIYPNTISRARNN